MSMIIGYTYEADEHCTSCASKRFIGTGSGPVDANGVPFDGTDDEGNPIMPRFVHDEVLETISCGTCGDTIVEAAPEVRT